MVFSLFSIIISHPSAAKEKGSQGKGRMEERDQEGRKKEKGKRKKEKGKKKKEKGKRKKEKEEGEGETWKDLGFPQNAPKGVKVFLFRQIEGEEGRLNVPGKGGRIINP